MNLTRLSILVKVHETGSMTAAADELRHTPSAVSQQLRKLEHEVGQPLFQRYGNGLVPTDAGKLLIEQSRRILAQVHSTEQKLSEIREGKTATLKIGSFPTLAASRLPHVIERFDHAHPYGVIELASARRAELINMLLDGRVELSFLWRYKWENYEFDSFNTISLFDEKSVVIVSKKHRLAGRHVISLGELEHESWIVRSNNHPVIDTLKHAATHAKFQPKIAMYVNNYHEAQALTSVGMGVTMLPESALTLKHPDIEVLSLGVQAPIREVVLAHHTRTAMTPIARNFTDILLSSIDP